MLVNYFNCLREHGVPVTIREQMDLLAALDKNIVFADTQDFYYLSRTVMVKDEKYFDRFDRAFGAFVNGLDSVEGLLEALIPEEWLRSEFFKQLSDEEKAQIESLGGLDKLIEEFRKRLEEQKKQHQGGNKWIGTGGTSPYGNSGYNPEGIRIGGQSTHRRAVKVWERRDYRNLDDSVELGTRNIKIALRRLRRFAREGAADELDLDDTIRSTARNAGMLDVKMVPERHNAVKVLLFFDSGGSMWRYVQTCEELFSATRTEFKHLEYFYFHNFIYESVWRDNHRRHSERVSTMDLLHRYPRDYKVIFVGDASMSPYEISSVGGSVEHYNDEPGWTWMTRILENWQKVIWLNPEPQEHWEYTQSNLIIRELLSDQMYPLTVKGIEEGMAALGR